MNTELQEDLHPELRTPLTPTETFLKHKNTIKNTAALAVGVLALGLHPVQIFAQDAGQIEPIPIIEPDVNEEISQERSNNHSLPITKGVDSPTITELLMPENGIARTVTQVNMRSEPTTKSDNILASLIPNTYIEITQPDVFGDNINWIEGQVLFSDEETVADGSQGFVATASGTTQFLEVIADISELPIELQETFKVTREVEIPDISSSMDLTQIFNGIYVGGPVDSVTSNIASIWNDSVTSKIVDKKLVTVTDTLDVQKPFQAWKRLIGISIIEQSGFENPEYSEEVRSGLLGIIDTTQFGGIGENGPLVYASTNENKDIDTVVRVGDQFIITRATKDEEGQYGISHIGAVDWKGFVAYIGEVDRAIQVAESLSDVSGEYADKLIVELGDLSEASVFAPIDGGIFAPKLNPELIKQVAGQEITSENFDVLYTDEDGTLFADFYDDDEHTGELIFNTNSQSWEVERDEEYFSPLIQEYLNGSVSEEELNGLIDSFTGEKMPIGIITKGVDSDGIESISMHTVLLDTYVYENKAYLIIGTTDSAGNRIALPVFLGESEVWFGGIHLNESLDNRFDDIGTVRPRVIPVTDIPSSLSDYIGQTARISFTTTDYTEHIPEGDLRNTFTEHILPHLNTNQKISEGNFEGLVLKAGETHRNIAERDPNTLPYTSGVIKVQKQ